MGRTAAHRLSQQKLVDGIINGIVIYITLQLVLGYN